MVGLVFDVMKAKTLTKLLPGRSMVAWISQHLKQILL